MDNKRATTHTDIHDIIAERWSPRAFDRDRPVAEDTLIGLLEAARWAPSCFNDQPWRYIVCDRATNEVAWNDAFSCLVEKNQLWAKNAPVLIFSCAKMYFTHNGNLNRWSEHDCGAASANMCLQATAYGLHIHQMGGFDADRVNELFKVPDDFKPMAAMAVGYMGDIGVLHEDFTADEQAPRERIALEKFAFYGEWKTPMVEVD